ncbi:hypothetical protein H6796_01360 [Candidatus Nomurabacteria bacterium]|nr:hypothetical protein [Candidatus Nomurabacteria bacterium]
MSDPGSYDTSSIYAAARTIAYDMLRRTSRIPRNPIKRSTEAAKKLRERGVPEAEYLMALLILQAPAAVRAQRQMDRREGGYNNRQARVFELIDFNDTFVDLVLSMPSEELEDFPERLRRELDHHCERMHTTKLTDRQYEAIVHGLSREIAVYRGAKKEGLLARMTSRVQDSRGVDMIITDPETKRSIAIDCKTSSSFHFRLLRLEEKRRINEQFRIDCEEAGFCQVDSGPKSDPSPTVLVRISTEHLGPITNFEFEDTTNLGELLRRALTDSGKYII